MVKNQLDISKIFEIVISKPIFMKIRDLILFIFDKIGLNEIFRLINKNKYIILCYHGVSHRYINFSYRHVAKSEFEEQVKYLIKKNYTFITLTNLINSLKNNRKLKEKCVILTFDDGFKDVIKNAYPVMKKYNAKGCLYIVSSLIGNEKLLWTNYIEALIYNSPGKIKFRFKDEIFEYSLDSLEKINRAIKDIKAKLRSVDNKDRISHLKQFKIANKISAFKNVPNEYIIVDWKDLSLLDKNILEIGSHTKTHPNLETLETKDEFFHELNESKLDIEKKIGYNIYHLCYPGGSFNNKTIHHAKNFGYLTGTTLIEGLNAQEEDLFRLKRLYIKNNFLEFKAKASGLYSFISHQILRFINKSK